MATSPYPQGGAGTPQPHPPSSSIKKTVLSDRYLIGEELGRGAYGQVYKGIDMPTSESVAIKQISLAGISADNLQGVMGEIE